MDRRDWCVTCERIVPDGVNGRPSKHSNRKHRSGNWARLFRLFPFLMKIL
jgi:hypothetical protein